MTYFAHKLRTRRDDQTSGRRSPNKVSASACTCFMSPLKNCCGFLLMFVELLLQDCKVIAVGARWLAGLVNARQLQLVIVFGQQAGRDVQNDNSAGAVETRL